MQVKFTTQRPDLLTACHRFVSTDERFDLTGVLIQRSAEGVILTATDGHRAFRAHDVTGNLEGNPSAILAVDPGRKMAAGWWTATDAIAEGRTITATNARGKLITAPIDWIDARFPDADVVFREALAHARAWEADPARKGETPDELTNKDRAHFQAKYISDFDDVGRRLSGDKLVYTVHHRIYRGDPLSCALVTFPAGIPAHGVIMPVRIDNVPGFKVDTFVCPAPTTGATE